MSEKNRTLLMVAYGSLLSGYGILAERRGGGSRLVARDAFPLTLTNARRGLAKPSSHGHYLAMDLEQIDGDAPIVADVTDGTDAEGIGVLGLVFDREWAPKIARREEYDPGKFVELIELADKANQPLGEFLLAIAQRTNFDHLAYRTALRELLDYTSEGYIFHPIPLRDGRIGVAAIGSGFEGSGDPSVRSKRHEYGMDRLLPLNEALSVSTFDLDTDGQVGYFVECLMGGIHGLGVADLAHGIDLASSLGADVKKRIAATLPLEHALFLQATSLDERRYRQAFSGLNDDRLEPFFAALSEK
ncbi:MAG TPA: hypothetical protein VMT61_18605 [Candidatus Binataceae bacterium]|nr:hypothetical protein [Candidatus Binataceae bacterium]